MVHQAQGLPQTWNPRPTGLDYRHAPPGIGEGLALMLDNEGETQPERCSRSTRFGFWSGFALS